MKVKKNYKAIGFIASALIFLSFQNCSQVDFASVDSSQSSLENQVCPTNYVLIPTNPESNNEEFCVSKTEMSGSGLVAQSALGGHPRVNVSREEAIQLCENIGLNYTLMREKDWKVILNWIETNPLNYSTNQVNRDNVALINTGHIQGDRYIASIPDQNLQTRWSPDRRIHFIVNEDVLWDISGNLSEWLRSENNKVVGGNYTQVDSNIRKLEVRSNSNADALIGFRCVYLQTPDQIGKRIPASSPTPTVSPLPTATPWLPPTPLPTPTPSPIPAEKISCFLNGQKIIHGNSILAFRTSSVAHGNVCASEFRICQNGNLSGSYTYSTCAVIDPPPPTPYPTPYPTPIQTPNPTPPQCLPLGGNDTLSFSFDDSAANNALSGVVCSPALLGSAGSGNGNYPNIRLYLNKKLRTRECCSGWGRAYCPNSNGDPVLYSCETPGP